MYIIKNVNYTILLLSLPWTAILLQYHPLIRADKHTSSGYIPAKVYYYSNGRCWFGDRLIFAFVFALFPSYRLFPLLKVVLNVKYFPPKLSILTQGETYPFRSTVSVRIHVQTKPRIELVEWNSIRCLAST